MSLEATLEPHEEEAQLHERTPPLKFWPLSYRLSCKKSTRILDESDATRQGTLVQNALCSEIYRS